MNYFLFTGAVNVGKTETVWRLAQHLMGKGFLDLQNKVPPAGNPQSDFCALLQGTNSVGQRIQIIVNSAMDIEQNIDDLVAFCQTNIPYDMIISSARCEGYPIRNYFYTKLRINQLNDYVLELPMASISANHKNFILKRQWYRNKIDNIARQLLAGFPFRI